MSRHDPHVFHAMPHGIVESEFTDVHTYLNEFNVSMPTLVKSIVAGEHPRLWRIAGKLYVKNGDKQAHELRLLAAISGANVEAVPA